MSKYEIKKFVNSNQGKVILASSIVLALVLGASYMALEAPNQPQEQGSEFNRADLMFMNMMIVHHDQAIEMAELAENRTSNRNILDLSENISEAQRYENRKMSEWLREAGINPPTGGHRMAGMATRQEMNNLRQSEGREFDMLFSELMIEHHQGGIQMARAEVQNGKSTKVKDLAGKMVRVQQEEVDKMQNWRNTWNNTQQG